MSSVITAFHKRGGAREKQNRRESRMSRINIRKSELKLPVLSAEGINRDRDRDLGRCKSNEEIICRERYRNSSKCIQMIEEYKSEEEVSEIDSDKRIRNQISLLDIANQAAISTPNNPIQEHINHDNILSPSNTSDYAKILNISSTPYVNTKTIMAMLTERFNPILSKPRPSYSYLPCCCLTKTSPTQQMTPNIKSKWLKVLHKIILLHISITAIAGHYYENKKRLPEINLPVPIKEKRKTTKNKCLIMPDSLLNWCWAFVMSILLIWTAIYVPYRLAFLDEIKLGVLIMELIIDAIFVLDIIGNFFLPYYAREDVLVTNKREIAKNYLKKWFLIDLISSFPFELFDGSQKYNKALRLLRLPRLYKLLKVFKLMKLVKFVKRGRIHEKLFFIFNLNSGLTRLTKVLILMTFFVHCYSCLWYFMAKLTNFHPDCWIVRAGLVDSSNLLKYLNSLFWVLQTLTTVGYGDMPVTTELEIILAIFLMLFGVSLYSYTIANLSSIFSNMDSRNTKLNTKILSLNEFAMNAKMKPTLYFKILKVLERNASTGYYSYFDQEELMDELPATLRNEVLSETHKNILGSFSFFKDKHPQFVIDVLPMFRHISLSKDEILFRKGDWVEEIYFILRGRVGFVTEDGYLYRNYVAGSYFGDIEVFKSLQYREHSVIIMENTEILVLRKQFLDSIFKDYPFVKEEMRSLARQRDNKIVQAIELAIKANIKLDPEKLEILEEGAGSNVYRDFFTKKRKFGGNLSYMPDLIIPFGDYAKARATEESSTISYLSEDFEEGIKDLTTPSSSVSSSSYHSRNPSCFTQKLSDLHSPFNENSEILCETVPNQRKIENKSLLEEIDTKIIPKFPTEVLGDESLEINILGDFPPIMSSKTNMTENKRHSDENILIPKIKILETEKKNRRNYKLELRKSMYDQDKLNLPKGQASAFRKSENLLYINNQASPTVHKEKSKSGFYFGPKDSSSKTVMRKSTEFYSLNSATTHRKSKEIERMESMTTMGQRLGLISNQMHLILKRNNQSSQKVDYLTDNLKRVEDKLYQKKAKGQIWW